MYLLQWQVMTNFIDTRSMHLTACCFTCHMNRALFPRTPSWTWLEAREADTQLACKLAVDIPVTNWLMTSLLDMWHDHPGKFVLTLLNVYNFYATKLFAATVIQDAVLGPCTFLLCQWSKQLVTDCHWSNTCMGMIIASKFGTFSRTGIYLVICSNFVKQNTFRWP